MTAITLEERVKVLEKQVKTLTDIVDTVSEIPQNASTPPAPWWKKIVGVYKDDPEFDEAERLGRAYRKSQRTETLSPIETETKNTP
jgi:hypothetical protein